MIRAALSAAVILAGMVTASTLNSGPPRLALADRIAAASSDIAAGNRCAAGPGQCWRVIASYGLDPAYYQGPDEWLSAECGAGDATACRYRDAWRIAAPDQ